MSFLARPIRPLVCRALASSMPSRSFTYARSALLTSGYGNSTQVPKNGSADPIAGGEVPEYSGPSIAEKKKGRAVHTENKEQEMKQKMKSEDANQRQGKHIAGGTLKDVRAKRPYSTSAFRSSPPPSQLSDDASRLASKAQTKATKMKHTVQDAAAEMKDGAQDLFHKAKKTARSIKDKVSDVMEDTTQRVSDAGQRAAEKVADSSEGGVFTPMYGKSPDSGLTKDPVRDDELPGVRMPVSDDTAAKSSAVPSSIFDGPQSMPQGVGRCARNEKNQPLETGTRGS